MILVGRSDREGTRERERYKTSDDDEELSVGTRTEVQQRYQGGERDPREKIGETATSGTNRSVTKKLSVDLEPVPSITASLLHRPRDSLVPVASPRERRAIGLMHLRLHCTPFISYGRFAHARAFPCSALLSWRPRRGPSSSGQPAGSILLSSARF